MKLPKQSDPCTTMEPEVVIVGCPNGTLTVIPQKNLGTAKGCKLNVYRSVNGGSASACLLSIQHKLFHAISKLNSWLLIV